MVDRDVVARRLLILNEAIRDIEQRFGGEPSILARDPVLRAAVERWVQVAIEACVDMAYHRVADQGWTPPATARDAFASLVERDGLDPALASRLGRAVGLRSVLVHEYADVDLERLARAVRDGLGDLKAFAGAAARWLEEDLTP